METGEDSSYEPTGEGVDRTLIRDLLQLTPGERIRVTAASSRKAFALVERLRAGLDGHRQAGHDGEGLRS